MRFWILIATLVVAPLSVSAEPAAPTQTYTYQFTDTEIAAIYDGLRNLPRPRADVNVDAAMLSIERQAKDNHVVPKATLASPAAPEVPPVTHGDETVKEPEKP
jgi:hypothetical protein